MAPLHSRALADRLLAVIGIVLVSVQIYVQNLSLGNAVVLALGVLLIYVGSWRLAGPLLHRRANAALRKELDGFTSLVRQLSSHNAKSDGSSAPDTTGALRESLERIIAAAQN